MGLNSISTAWGYGQLGSGHVVAHATSVFPPRGKVIVAITFLDDTYVDKLVADTVLVKGTSSTNPSADDTAFFGSGAQVAANGGDGLAGGYNQALAEAIDTAGGDATVFPKGLTIYGRWTSVSLQADSTHGVICYYGPAHVGAAVPAIS